MVDGVDWLDWSEQLIDSLAWPMVLALGLVLFRNNLRDLIDDLGEVRFGKASISRTVDRIRSASDELEAERETDEDDAEPDGDGPEDEQPEARISPSDARGAMIVLWHEIETATYQRLADAGWTRGVGRPKKIESLLPKYFVEPPSSLLRTLRLLRELRNRANSSHRFVLSADDLAEIQVSKALIVETLKHLEPKD